MIWRTVGLTLSAPITDALTAEIVPCPGGWFAKIGAKNRTLWIGELWPEQEQAKQDACGWMRKAITQLSNALAMGYCEVDEE